MPAFASDVRRLECLFHLNLKKSSRDWEECGSKSSVRRWARPLSPLFRSEKGRENYQYRANCQASESHNGSKKLFFSCGLQTGRFLPYGLLPADKGEIAMLMLRAKPPESWLTKVMANLDAVLVDHAHLERKAAQSALKLQRYQQLSGSLKELTEIAVEELEHFNLVLNLLDCRGIALGQAISSPWISGMMNAVRKGRNEQVIDHLLCAAMIEGRSCEKFQLLSEALRPVDAHLAKFYGDLVVSEGNHYAMYLLMAKRIDENEAERRLDYYLTLDAELVVQPSELPILH